MCMQFTTNTSIVITAVVDLDDLCICCTVGSSTYIAVIAQELPVQAMPMLACARVSV